MKKINILKLLFCFIVILVVTWTENLYSQTGNLEKAVLNKIEQLGKTDPFEKVKTINDKNALSLNRGAPGAYMTETRPDLFVETVMLKFLQAENLEKAIKMMSSDYGTIQTDKETNSLIICDTKETLGKIITQIRKADQTPPQISIEVVILDVKIDDDSELGVDWESLFDPVHSKTYIQTLAGVVPTVSGASFNLIQGGISVTVKALQATKDVEILANPHMLVLSGQETRIETTEEIPYSELSDSTDGSAQITTTQFKSAGITLSVKATLTDEKKILLVIDVQQSINAGVDTSIPNNSVPVVDKRIAQTTLLMNDDQVVVMSGLRQKETKFTQSKVPLLGDLPILGGLFSNDKKEIKNTELLVFISPHIYENGPLPDDQQEKFDELRDAPVLQFPDKVRPIYKYFDKAMPSYYPKTPAFEKPDKNN